MVERHYVKGYDEFVHFFETFKSSDPIYVLYTGSKLENEQSWCPDCVQAEPVIDKAFEAAPKPCHLVIVEVGDRAFWKDNNCVFRTSCATKLKFLPTLAKWGTQKRLEGEQCKMLDLIKLLLTDEDDD